jgi:hypothetical protein
LSNIDSFLRKKIKLGHYRRANLAESVRSQSQTWDDAVPEADNSRESTEKIDKF